jgi:hypothetical protein
MSRKMGIAGELIGRFELMGCVIMRSAVNQHFVRPRVSFQYQSR